MCLPVGPGASIGSITALAALPALDVRELGPELGGRLDGIVVLADGTILVASPGGGVWRRPFDSLSWEQPANRGLIDYTIQHLELDLLDPAIVYAVGRNGLFRTANRGDDWELLVGGAIGPVLPSTDAVDPAPFAQLRVSESDRVLFWSYPCRGLYWSLDSLRWRRARIDPDAASSPDNCLAQIVADAETQRLYVTTLRQNRHAVAGVFRTAEPWTADTSRPSFELANRGLPRNTILQAVTTASAPGSGVVRLVGVAEPIDGSRTTTTFVGADEPVADPERGETRFSWRGVSTITVDGFTPRSLVHAGGGELFHGNRDPFQSLDLGGSWCNVRSDGDPANPCIDGLTPFLMHADVRGLFVQPSALWAVTDGARNDGMQANVVAWPRTAGARLDPAAAQLVSHSDLRVWQTYAAATVALGTVERRVFVGSQDNIAVCFNSAEVGSHTDQGAPPAGGDVYSIVVAPSDSNRAYAIANNSRFTRTFNAASTSPNGCAAVLWDVQGDDQANLEARLPCDRQEWHRNTMAVSPTNPDLVFLACSSQQFGVAVTENGGTSWLVRELPGRPSVTAAHIDDFGFLFAGTRDRGIWVSVDEGRTWSPLGLQAESVLAIAGRIGDTLWAATSEGLYRRVAGPGRRLVWRLALGAPELVVSDVVVDPTCRSRVYAGLGFWSGRQQHGGGVWMSTDGGERFDPLPFEDDLVRAPISDLELDPADPSVLLAATYGRGVWRLQWTTGVPQCDR